MSTCIGRIKIPRYEINDKAHVHFFLKNNRHNLKDPAALSILQRWDLVTAWSYTGDSPAQVLCLRSLWASGEVKIPFSFPILVLNEADRQVSLDLYILELILRQKAGAGMAGGSG